MAYVVVSAVTVWGFAASSVAVFEDAVLNALVLDGTVYPVTLCDVGSSDCASVQKLVCARARPP